MTFDSKTFYAVIFYWRTRDVNEVATALQQEILTNVKK